MKVAIFVYEEARVDIISIPGDVEDVEYYIYRDLNYSRKNDWMEISSIYMDIK